MNGLSEAILSLLITISGGFTWVEACASFCVALAAAMAAAALLEGTAREGPISWERDDES